MGLGIPCWPDGYDTRPGDCDEELPADDHVTMSRFGWGWVWARDPFSASGQGPFLACPEHRSDCTEEERERFRQQCAAAKASLSSAEGREP